MFQMRMIIAERIDHRLQFRRTSNQICHREF